MKPRTSLLVLAFCLLGALTCFADDLNVGTWKLNEAKSKIPAGAPKNTTVIYTADGDRFDGKVDGVGADGKPLHSEWTGKFDGKEYPVAGDPNSDARAIKMVDKHHYTITGVKGGKENTTGTIVISPSGKTRTVTIHSTDEKGNKTTAVYVYDKQ